MTGFVVILVDVTLLVKSCVAKVPALYSLSNCTQFGLLAGLSVKSLLYGGGTQLGRLGLRDLPHFARIFVSVLTKIDLTVFHYIVKAKVALVA